MKKKYSFVERDTHSRAPTTKLCSFTLAVYKRNDFEFCAAYSGHLSLSRKREQSTYRTTRTQPMTVDEYERERERVHASAAFDARRIVQRPTVLCRTVPWCIESTENVNSKEKRECDAEWLARNFSMSKRARCLWLLLVCRMSMSMCSNFKFNRTASCWAHAWLHNGIMMCRRDGKTQRKLRGVRDVSDWHLRMRQKINGDRSRTFELMMQCSAEFMKCNIHREIERNCTIFSPFIRFNTHTHTSYYLYRAEATRNYTKKWIWNWLTTNTRVGLSNGNE